MAQNPGIANAFDRSDPNDLLCLQTARGLFAENQAPAMCPEGYLHSRSKAMAKVPIPPCRGAVRMRWLQFLLQMDLDPDVSGKVRRWVFQAAKQYEKERQLGWSHSTCRTLHRLLQGHAATTPVAPTAREKRLATAILAHYSPSFSPVAYGVD